MAAKTDEDTTGCTFQWEIENISLTWLKKGERMKSPTFNADGLEGTKWSLWLSPMGYIDENCVSIYVNRETDCSGPDVIEVNFQLAILGKDGSLLEKGTPYKHSFVKGNVWGLSFFKKQKIVFFKEKGKFLPGDTLTVQCKIWNQEKMPLKLKHLFVRTTFRANRRYLVWIIDKISTLKSGLRKKFKNDLIDFDLIFNKGFDRLDIDMISFDDNIKYISCNTWIIGSDGKKENCGIKEYVNCNLEKGVFSTLFYSRMLMENKRQYLPNDVLRLEFVLSTVEYFVSRKNYNFESKLDCRVKEKSENVTVMTDDFKSMYDHGSFSDMEIRTSSKSFPAHKNILSARSPVFNRMFSRDMKETSGHIDISDIEDDTVQRMLLYIYTDSLEDLQLESACKLYAAAYKYEILSLKTKCSSFIKDNLCPTKVCSILALTDLHRDNDLKSFVENYILVHDKKVFGCQEWKDLMNTNPKLAADLMYRKFFPG